MDSGFNIDSNDKRIKYPIGQQDFAKLRQNSCVYIDKTELIYELAQSPGYLFLARPRRFGKSLMLSTLRYYFEGRKDLFEGLRIMDLEKEWKKYPVLHLELSGIKADDYNALMQGIDQQFRKWEFEYDIQKKSDDLSARFRDIIWQISIKTGERVVILVDEYDNPLINTLGNKEIHSKNRELLKSIYSNLKAMDEYIRFGMLTGVSRFSSLTIFSGLNNLQDLTFDTRFSAICGFTEEEIRDDLWPGVEKLASAEETTPEEALRLLKREYDGYHFTADLKDIYNPFSVLNSLNSSSIQNYWFKSGTPTFLIKNLEDNHREFSKIFNADADMYSLGTIDSAFDNPVSLLFQTGYLTIKSFDKRFQEFSLRIPNREVEQSLMLVLLGHYTRGAEGMSMRPLWEMTRSLEKGEPEEFISRLRSILAPISYHFHGKMTELDFERTMFVILHLIGLEVSTELQTSRGRIDIVVKTEDYIYVMELKLDKSAREAMDQINTKEYALQWDYDRRKVIKIGMNFSSEQRNIAEWIIGD